MRVLLWIAFVGSLVGLAGYVGLSLYYRRIGRSKPPVLAGSITGSLAVILLVAMMLRGVDQPFTAQLLVTSSILLVLSMLLLVNSTRRRTGPATQE